MAKESERSVARILYIEQGKNNKEIAQKLGVQEKTVGTWVKKYGWKKERNARENGLDSRVQNVREVIDDITADRRECRLLLKKMKLEAISGNLDDNEKKELRDKISALKKEIVGYDDAISKWNKHLEGLGKEGKISLATYLYVMDEVFKDLQATNEDLYIKTLDFQEAHISKVSISIG